MEDKGTKNKILERAMDLFFQFGFSKVSMDELASGLSMSKKTIYKYFPGKKVLIWAIVNSTKHEVGTNVERIANDESLPYEDRLKEIMNFIGMRLSRLQKPILVDVQKNFPEIWEDVSNYRIEMLTKNLKMILDKGVEAGTFRSDINKELFMMMYLNTVQTIVTPYVLAELPLTTVEVFEMIVKVFFGGILTEEAQKKVFQEE